MSNLVSLTYRSRVRLADPTADLMSIMQASRLRNARLGVTGILLYNGFHFVQTIEGTREACDTLFAHISKDARHEEILAFGLREIEAREFPDWSMRLLSREELRALMPELKLLDLKEAGDIETMHRAISARLAGGAAALEHTPGAA